MLELTVDLKKAKTISFAYSKYGEIEETKKDVKPIFTVTFKNYARSIPNMQYVLSLKYH